VVATPSLSALEKHKLVSESVRRRLEIDADKKRLEHEKRMAIAAPSYNSQNSPQNQYAQCNSLANMGASQMNASQMSPQALHAYMQAQGVGYGQMMNVGKASAPMNDLVERVVSVEIDPTTDAGVYSLLIKDESGGYQFHISDAMLKTLHKKWLMARNRAEEDGVEFNNSEEGESDVE
jgi:hypothetical protein